MKLMQYFVPMGNGPARVSLSFGLAGLSSIMMSATVIAAGLNDTGFTTCADAAGATVSCTAPSAVPGQDARYGRDAAAATSALTKVGGGANGFDFTKISNAGAVLPATAPLGPAAGEWGCTYDNTTGLMWEVKTATAGLRYGAYSYSWYSSNSATNGGGFGVASAGANCFAAGRCDTEKFTQDVNAAGMCGRNDWRMPTVRELQSLLRLGSSPAIDIGYFPNTYSIFWSASPNAARSNESWLVVFNGEYPVITSKSNTLYVRLVRSAQ